MSCRLAQLCTLPAMIEAASEGYQIFVLRSRPFLMHNPVILGCDMLPSQGWISLRLVKKPYLRKSCLVYWVCPGLRTAVP